MTRCIRHPWRLGLARLNILSGKEICKILGGHGFKEVKRRGSHRFAKT